MTFYDLNEYMHADIHMCSIVFTEVNLFFHFDSNDLAYLNYKKYIDILHV